IEYKTDIDHALESVLITNKMREYIALKFNLKFNIMQIMNIMKLNIPDLLDLEDEIFEVLEALLNGYMSEYERFDKGTAVDLKTYMMMIEIMHVNPLKDVGYRVRQSVLEYLAYEENDEKAKAALGLLKDSKGEWTENDSELKIYW